MPDTDEDRDGHSGAVALRGPGSAEAEAAFQRYLEVSAPYFEAVAANGDMPWFSSVEQRRELFYRRYKSVTPTNTQENAE